MNTAAAAAAKKGPRACTTCAKAKSRCIPGPAGSSKCERCHRLQKPCGLQTPAPPRAKKEPRPTKVSELERRLNDLTTQLRAVQHTAPPLSPPSFEESSSSPNMSNTGPTASVADEGERPPASSGSFYMQHLFPAEKPSAPGVDMVPACFPELYSQHLNSKERKASGLNLDKGLPTPHTSPSDGNGDLEMERSPSPEPSSSAQYTSTTSPNEQSTASQQATESWPTLPPLWPPDAEADGLLNSFAVRRQRAFPFVLLPRGATSAQMKKDRPLFLRAVMVVECFGDGRRQSAMGREFLDELVRAAFTKTKGVGRLDLLQAILLMIAWFHCDINSHQVTHLLYLARSTAINLEPSVLPSPDTGLYTPAALEMVRAMIGCFYVNAVVFTTNQRPEAFMPTATLDRYCKTLEIAAEFPSDQDVLQLARVQKLAQTIVSTMTGDMSGPLQHMQYPLMIVIRSFQQQIDEIKNSLPARLENPNAIKAQIGVTEILLYDISHSTKPSVASALTLTDRLELLWNCLNATRTFLDLHFMNIDLDWQCFPALAASDLVFGLLTSLRLLMFKAAGWDPTAVQKRLRFDESLERKACEMDILARMRKEGPYTKALMRLSALGAVPPLGLDHFERLSISMRHLKAMLNRELGLVVTELPACVPSEAANVLEDSFPLIADLDVPLLHDFVAEDMWLEDMDLDVSAGGMALVNLDTTSRPPW